MVGERRRRLLVVLETHWDRRQLEACRPAWERDVEIVYAEPNDFDCPSDFDALGFIDAVVAGRYGRIDGVLSSSDYPGATLAAAIATRLGLPGSRPEHVIRASHKWYSREVQARAAPAATPRFALVDPARPEAAAPLPLPFFLKPVKGAFSVLARRIDSAEAFASFLRSEEVQEFTRDYMGIFNGLVAGLTELTIDGRFFLAEELLHGRLFTVEGWVRAGQVALLGIVDSGLHPSGSFARFDHPSTLPEPVQRRAAEAATRVIRALELESTLWNIEMMWDEARDRVSIIEVNPRICGQFADLYAKVDGTNGYEVALRLALGEAPRVQQGAGAHAAAASFPLRVHAPCRVRSAPDAAAIAAAEALFPDAKVWNECSAGEALEDFAADEDGASHRYAVVNLGGASRADLDSRLAAIEARLGYAMQPL